MKVNIKKTGTHRRKSLKPGHMILLGFALIIFAGALLLYTPLANKTPEGTSFLNCLFTSTSAVCVTGLAVVDTGTNWSIFGKIIIIILIQTGGLGFMSIGSGFALALNRKIGIKERILLRESINVNDVSGIVRLIRSIIIYTGVIEFAGACLLATRFIPKFGILKGIGFSLFHSISAFCNAGFDLFGPYYGKFTSLINFYNDPVIVFTISALIILGGIGFAVIYFVSIGKKFKEFNLTSKIAVKMTLFLLIFGTVLILIGEWNNPETIKNLPIFEKFQIGFFQSVTARTAGFATIDLTQMKESTLFLMIFLMFIGASPSSTGGGIKTTTIAVIFATVRAFLKNEDNINLSNRRISIEVLKKAMGMLSMGILFVTVGTWLLSATQGDNYGILECGFEAVSAFATVGLSIGGTPTLNTFGKIVIMILMYSGRVGILTMLTLFIHSKSKRNITYPEGKISIG